MKRILLPLFAAFICSSSAHGAAHDAEEVFFQKIEGQWAGAGEVVAGKYKGTKFTCVFSGAQEQTKVGMALDGSCRVGIFSQAVKARVVRIEKGYQGTFNNGAKADGMDITSGRIGKKHMVFGLVRENINGTMTAHLADNDTMNITLSVKVSEDMVPVVGVKLKRNGKNTVQNTAQNEFK
ncbi:hypothetical protein N5853_07685 [Bartonella sp. HY329]|uniref:hypothetical protein n=1 Tax=unclassified Bartonella TaxID=2645622 RepID=UPI0021CAD102|nr:MULTISPECIES: hypothetical protein [unclassified Bartonella]UXM94004.1 hypothetical protein N5853_07685 [Bartonella sp. HY329]UXN08326.1 hypothetical protein N5852_07695 [Bartonella sp. HY328]